MSVDTYPPAYGSSPSAVLGHAQSTVTQGSIPATTVTDITGLATTITVPAGRTLRITAQALLQANASNMTAILRIQEGATELNETQVFQGTSGNGFTASLDAIVNPTAGTHTYKATIYFAGGTNNSVLAGAQYPAFITVEDITGGTGGPGPIQLAYAKLETTQATISSAVDVTNLTCTVTVSAGRTIRIRAEGLAYGTVVDDVAAFDLYEDGVRVQIRQFLFRPAGTSGNIGWNVSRTLTPTAGTHTYKVQARRSSGSGTFTIDANTAYPCELTVEDITGTPAPGGLLPSSQTLGYAEVVAQQTGLTSEVDLTGLSVTIAVPAGRRIQVTGHGYLQNTGSGNLMYFTIYQDGSQVQSGQLVSGGVSLAEKMTTIWVGSPSAGTHTYKLRAGTAAGTASLIAGAAYPAFILVEDITGGAPPVPAASVPVGVIAQAIATANVNSIGNTDLVLLSVNVAVPAGRILKLTAGANLTNNTIGGRSLGAIWLDGVAVGRWCDRTSSAAGYYESASDSVLISPSAGSHTINMTMNGISGSTSIEAAGTEPIHLIVEDVTPTPAPAMTAPSSTLGYAEQPSALTGLTTALTDITGLSVTVTVAAGRRLRVRGHVIGIQGTAVENKCAVYILEGATKLGFAEEALNPTVGTSSTVDPECIITPSAGTHTYKLAGQFTAGSSNQFFRDPTNGQVCYILVEDITSVATSNLVVPGALVVTSSTRPGSPLPGTMIYESDTTMVMTWNGIIWAAVSPRSTIYAVTPALTATATFPALVGTLTIPAVTYPTHHHIEAQMLLGGGTTNDQFELAIYDGTTTAGTLLRAIRWTNQLNTNVDQRNVSYALLDIAASVAKTYTLWATRTSGAGTLAVTGDPRYSVFINTVLAAG